MSVLICRSFEFDAGHRLVDHEGQCKFLHGHHYKAEYFMLPLTGKTLDSVGRVLDFGVVKQRVTNWIDTNWDHNMVLSMKDPLCEFACAGVESPSDVLVRLCGRKPYLMPNNENPTAENMAKELWQKTRLLLPEVQLISVRLWETPKCYAEFIAGADSK